MAYKDPIQQAEYQRKYRLKHRDRIRALQKDREASVRTHRCACGNPAALLKEGQPVCHRCDRLEHQRGDNE